MQFFYNLSKIKGRKYWEVNIDGIKIRLSFSQPYHYLIARQMHHEEYYQNILTIWKRAVEKTTGTIIDCGGYNGIYGIIASKVNPSAKIFIIEPDDINVKHIKDNIKLNNVNNITVVQSVVYDVEGKVKFHPTGGHTGGFISNTGKDIDSVILDSFKDVSLVKISTEGAEYQVLLGGKWLLERGVDILLQLHRKEYLDRFNVKESDIWNLLQKYKYKNIPLYISEKMEHHWLYKSK